jgi:hypothetical protein
MIPIRHERDCIRLALGQLLGYRRFVKQPRYAIDITFAGLRRYDCRLRETTGNGNRIASDARSTDVPGLSDESESLRHERRIRPCLGSSPVQVGPSFFNANRSTISRLVSECRVLERKA